MADGSSAISSRMDKNPTLPAPTSPPLSTPTKVIGRSVANNPLKDIRLQLPPLRRRLAPQAHSIQLRRNAACARLDLKDQPERQDTTGLMGRMESLERREHQDRMLRLMPSRLHVCRGSAQPGQQDLQDHREIRDQRDTQESRENPGRLVNPESVVLSESKDPLVLLDSLAARVRRESLASTLLASLHQDHLGALERWDPKERQDLLDPRARRENLAQRDHKETRATLAPMGSPERLDQLARQGNQERQEAASIVPSRELHQAIENRNDSVEDKEEQTRGFEYRI